MESTMSLTRCVHTDMVHPGAERGTRFKSGLRSPEIRYAGLQIPREKWGKSLNKESSVVDLTALHLLAYNSV
jgi:hypothetical protein